MLNDEEKKLKPDEEGTEGTEVNADADAPRKPEGTDLDYYMPRNQNKDLVSYVRPTYGSNMGIYHSSILTNIQKDFSQKIESWNLRFRSTKYMPIKPTKFEIFFNLIKNLGELYICDHDFCLIIRDKMIIILNISGTMVDTTIDVHAESLAESQAGVKLVEEALYSISAGETINMELRWYYFDHMGGIRSTTLIESLNDEFYKEAYPYLDIDKLIDDYLSCDEPLILLIGPPGTGKTMLIRHMLRKKHREKGSVRVLFTSEREVIEQSRIFMDFVLGVEADVLVIEDIDYHLHPREEGNTAMNNFLTASNGIVINHVKKKKIIFSTNLPDANNIDKALLRPGRCFKIVETRALNEKECTNLYLATGKEIPIKAGSHTIAELFNSKKTLIPRKIGF